MTREAWTEKSMGCQESETIEQLILTLFHTHTHETTSLLELFGLKFKLQFFQGKSTSDYAYAYLFTVCLLLLGMYVSRGHGFLFKFLASATHS